MPRIEIRAAVTESKGAPYAIQPVELDEPQAGEVLVRVAASGICHTDLIIRDQWYPVPLPAVLGHEGAGVVERVGPGVTTVAAGDRVAMSYGSCGDCPKCLVGRPYNCHDFFGRNFGATRPDGSTALSRGGEPVFIPRLIELWRQGRFPVDALMKSYDFDQIDEAAHDAEAGRVVKAVVKMA